MYENWKERNGISRQTKKKLEDQADRRKVLWRYTIAQSSFKRNQNYTFNFQLEPELEKTVKIAQWKYKIQIFERWRKIAIVQQKRDFFAHLMFRMNDNIYFAK